MLAVADAQKIVLEHTQPLPAEVVALTPAALGLILAEDVASDLDMPPFDKALMDGYAVCAADLAEGKATLTVVEEIMAGMTPTKSLASGQTARIMTGAPLPAGADAVVMVERSRPLDDGRVFLEDKRPDVGRNIMRRGAEMRRGETVLRAGTMLRPPELGMLASVGRTEARVYPAPRIAVMTTGDEIVEAGQRPGPGQIRNGNSPMLIAQVSRAGGVPSYLGIARDRPEDLKALIAKGLQAPVLVLSGGVSAGKLDLVPGVLQELGVRPHFHKVAMKPGKPIFFGTCGSTLVFGLPGNPVSSHVCFELFVRPALRKMSGRPDPGPLIVKAKLTEDFAYQTDRPTYHPAWLDAAEDGWHVRTVPWLGSPDLRGLTRANAFAVFEPGNHTFRAGQVVPVLCPSLGGEW